MKTILDNFVERRNYLVPALGSVPLLAGASTLAGGIAMGGFFLAALIINSVIIIVIRPLVPPEIRLVLIALVAALTVSILQLLMQTWFYDYSQLLDIYMPLVAMNCILLAIMNDQAMGDKFIQVIVIAAVTGIGILAMCTVTGAVRQYIDLPVIQGAPGVFLILALAIILLNVISNKEKTTGASAG